MLRYPARISECQSARTSRSQCVSWSLSGSPSGTGDDGHQAGNIGRRGTVQPGSGVCGRISGQVIGPCLGEKPPGPGSPRAVQKRDFLATPNRIRRSGPLGAAPAVPERSSGALAGRAGAWASVGKPDFCAEEPRVRPPPPWNRQTIPNLFTVGEKSPSRVRPTRKTDRGPRARARDTGTRRGPQASGATPLASSAVSDSDAWGRA